MSLLVRKIAFAKWEPHGGVAQGAIPADAVTGDLRTTNNQLSFWRVEAATLHELSTIVVALASAGDKLDKIDIVWIGRSKLEAMDIEFVETAGRTGFADAAKRHEEASRLDLSRLEAIAQNLSGAFQSSKRKRFTKSQVAGLLTGAIQNGRLDLNDLEDPLKTEIQQRLPPGSHR